LPTCIAIHNQCSSTKLVSPVYFINGATRRSLYQYPKLFDQQIDIGTEVWTSFEIDTIKNKFEGALLFKLNTSTTETNKDGATQLHILVTWKVKGAKSFTYVALIKHTKSFTWNKDKLKNLYDKNHSRLKKYDGITPDIWLMDDSMTLKALFEVMCLKGILKLCISISEEKRDDYAMRPLCINLER
jgi:sulfite reductase alpha subunit-like flavoprotein